MQHPCEYTPLITHYLRNLSKDKLETLDQYLDMILIFSHASAGKIVYNISNKLKNILRIVLKDIMYKQLYNADQTTLQALLEVTGSVPQFATRIYENELSWLRTLLISTKLDVRQLVAKIYGIITTQLSNNEFETQISEIMNIMDKNSLEAQHGSLLTLTCMMERRLVFKRNNMDNDFFNWDLYINVVKMICMYIFSYIN